MVSIPGVTDIIHEVGETIRKIVPDADKRLDIEVQLQQLQQNLQLAQIDVNKTEASSSNIFVAGWRPSIGWVCSAALAYTWILAPLIQYGVNLTGAHTALPVLPPDSIFPVVTAMLGISVSRTVEKVSGVSTGQLGNIQGPTLETSKLNPKNWFQQKKVT